MAHRHIFKDRAGLGAYIDSPETFPASRVISYNKDFVVINDLYPKSSVHVLLLPREPAISALHPLTALTTNPAFLASVNAEVDKLKDLVASELRRLYGQYSASDSARNSALEEIMSSADDPPTGASLETLLPPGRDWRKEVVAGVHAHPSMSHLHIHILSLDRHSPFLKHRKHYNSFATPFFVPLSAFPLGADDNRWHPGREGYLKMDMVCWRCGRGFGNRFKSLKEHLEGEFELWKGV
ncbi:histidine triad nucleotide-binding protein [Lepidopterella palustris CBS 459.81]|uniref:Aprataxin-like protein n=1 Tax=Lepidopterella palustris CBS 459.81 TaxID=1314670 RepID=A0A8E2E1I9_9PEZI|nr:histidine triad nucleotide-binding protein [Lepidopterella palustris CBS 459.81]